jgi:hypothetical protein
MIVNVEVVFLMSCAFPLNRRLLNVTDPTAGP